MVNIQYTVQILLDSIVKNCSPSPLSPSISMVPGRIRDVNPKSFTPRVVSIGPLHSKSENVQAFEAQKATYMYHLLGRLKMPPEESLLACVEKVSALIEEIRKSYDSTEAYNDDELAKMMVMDGCFILEFCLKLSHGDLINGLLVNSIIDDLLLVENQIPFFVLEDIFERTVFRVQQTVPLSRIIHPLLKLGNLFQINLDELMISADTRHDHILGMLHQCYQPLPTHTVASRGLPSSFRSVEELHMAGVNFKPNRNVNWAMAMGLEWSRSASFLWFRSKPALKMPILVINDSTESLLRNLIAYEHSSSEVNNYVTSYAMAMDMLIDTPEDIRILVESQAIVNYMGSNKAAAEMMNSICKEVVAKDFFYVELSQQLHEYYKAYWAMNIARVKRKYCNSTWNNVALLATTILFVLTVIQTIYAIKPVKND